MAGIIYLNKVLKNIEGDCGIVRYAGLYHYFCSSIMLDAI